MADDRPEVPGRVDRRVVPIRIGGIEISPGQRQRVIWIVPDRRGSRTLRPASRSEPTLAWLSRRRANSPARVASNKNLNEVNVHGCSPCDETRAKEFARGPTALSSVTIPYNCWGVASGKWAHASTATRSLMVASEGRVRPSLTQR